MKHPLEGGTPPEGKASRMMEADDVKRGIDEIVHSIGEGKLAEAVSALEQKGWTFDGPFWDFMLGRRHAG